MIKKYLVNYRNVTLLIILSVIFGFVRNVVLGRMLSINDFGVYSLSLSVIGILSALLLFGQQRGIIRFFIKKNVTDYNWKTPILIQLLISIPITVISLPIISSYYNVDYAFTYFCVCVIVSTVITDLLINIVRSSGKFELALILQRMIRIIVAITAIIFFINDTLRLTSIFYFFGSIHFIYGVFVYNYVIRKINLGSNKVPFSSQKEGLYFSALDVISLINIYGINLIIVEILSINYLGIFFAFNIILRVYEIFAQSTDFVTMPSSKEIDRSGLIIIVLKNLIIGSAISLFFLTFGDYIVSQLYLKKYDAYLNLIPLICLIGQVKMMDSIPLSIVGGISKKTILTRYVQYNSILTIIFIPGSIFSIKYFGLMGAAYALIILHLLRSIYGFRILYERYKL